MKNKTSFYMLFTEPYFNKGDTLISEKGVILKVNKVWRNTWWNRFLRKIGLSTKKEGWIKVTIL